MRGADFLLTVAEIAIAFVGFSAVVIAFRESGGQRMSPYQHLQIRVMIEFGFSTLFLAGVPLVLSFLDIAPSLVWRISHGIFGFFLVVYFANYQLRRRPSTRSRHKPSAFKTLRRSNYRDIFAWRTLHTRRRRLFRTCWPCTVCNRTWLATCHCGRLPS